MNATTQFPWAMVVSNAVWICGLAVILAALGWHDYMRREHRERNLKVAATTNEAAESPDVAAGFSLRQDRRNLKVAATNQNEPSLKAAAIKRATDEPPDATADLPSDVAAGFSLRSGGPSSFRRDSSMKPILLGLIMVAGGAALSVGSPLFATIFAIGAFGLVVVFVKRFFLGRAKSAVDEKEKKSE